MAACTGLACPSVKVRPDDDLSWLASCPAEARETVRLLHLDPGGPNEEPPADGELEDGPSVIVPEEGGCEVKEGRVELNTLMSPGVASGTLVGTAVAGSDRVHFRFNELVWKDEGKKFPICAIGSVSFLHFGPGIPLVAKNAPHRLPDSKLHPGYLYITTGRMNVRLAPYIPNCSQPASGTK